MFIKSDSGLELEVTFRGREEFGIKYDDNDMARGKAWILADSIKDIIVDIKCFKADEAAVQQELILELYVDGILRNIVKPRTGRGLAENQVAEAMIDRGVVMTEDGTPVLKKFRFIDLDLDGAILTSRIVEEAGAIEVRIVQAGFSFDEDDDISFGLPDAPNDCGAVSILNGELNNTVGIRFDDGDESIRDTKEIRLDHSVELMLRRQDQMLGKTVAVFNFKYADEAILHHLGLIKSDHKRYNEDMASERSEVRTRYDGKLSKVLIDKAVFKSDYSLTTETTHPNSLTDGLPEQAVRIDSQPATLPIKAGSASTPDRVTKKRGRPPGSVNKKGDRSPPLTPKKKRGRPAGSRDSRMYRSPSLTPKKTGEAASTTAHEMDESDFTTPKKSMSTLQIPLTPPETPGLESTIVFDMTQSEDEVMEIICYRCT